MVPHKYESAVFFAHSSFASRLLTCWTRHGLPAYVVRPRRFSSAAILRCDIPCPELAQLVLDLLVGDVARRFMQGEPESDPRLIGRVLRLVEAHSTRGVP